MINLTTPSGSAVQINGDRVTRIRAAFSDESDPPAKTRIDWVNLQFVLEEPGSVAQQVKQENRSLTQLAAPNGSPFWFDVRQAAGPIRIFPSQIPDGTHSAIFLANKTQFVSNTPQQVRDVIAAAGGSPLPIPSEGFAGVVANAVGKLRNRIAPQTNWD